MTTYGRWTLVGEPFHARGGRDKMHRAVCGGCQRELVVRMDHLKAGRSSSCGTCSQRRGPRARKTGAYDRVAFHGITKRLTEWCDEYGVTVNCYRERVSRGMDPFEALTTPSSKPHNHGVGIVESIVVDSKLEFGEAAATLNQISAAAGTTRARIEQVTELALKRAQVSTVTIALAKALPGMSEEYVAELVALAIDMRLGFALTVGDYSVMELRELNEKWRAHVEKSEAGLSSAQCA